VHQGLVSLFIVVWNLILAKVNDLELGLELGPSKFKQVHKAMDGYTKLNTHTKD
jgi:hypothetical protein